MKAREVEDIETKRGLINGILNGADIPKECKLSIVKLLHMGWKKGRVEDLTPDRDKCDMRTV